MTEPVKTSKKRKAARYAGEAALGVALLVGLEALLQALEVGAPSTEHRMWYGAAALGVGAVLRVLRGSV